MRKKYIRIANAVLDLDSYKESRHGNIDTESNQRLRLNRNESTIEPSPRAVLSIKDFLDNRPLNWYPDSDAGDLKQKISEYTRMPVENISCLPGVNSALDYISRTFLEPGTEMLACGPVFYDETLAARIAGARVVEAAQGDPFSPGIEPVINNITKRTRILYIGNPSGITGSFFTEAELVFLLAYAENTMVVINESYFEFSGFSAVELVEKFPNLIIVRSFSHAFGLAALKAAYIISDPENIAHINRLRSEVEVDAVSQIAAGAVMENSEYMLEYVKSVDQSKKILSSNLPEIGYGFYITPANFFLLRVSNPAIARHFLEDNGVLVRDFSGIEQLNDFLRISIGTPEQTDMLLLILSRMAERFATGFNRNRLNSSPGRIRDGASEATYAK